MNRLREIREEAGLSQERLARRADISVRTVVRLDRGGVPSLPVARKIAAALGRSVDELWPELAA